MNKRDRFLAFAGFERVDRVPRRARYTPALQKAMSEHLGRDPVEYFDMDDCDGPRPEPPEGFSFPDYSVYHPGREDGQDGFTIDGNGCGHLNHGFYHFTEYISPLRNAASFEEIEQYPIASNTTWSSA